MEEFSNVRVDVVAVQEIRWQRQGRTDTEDFSLFHNGLIERTSWYRTGFIINAKMRKKPFLSFEPLSNKLCKLRLRGKFKNITLLST
jgi:hypothetical protein